MRYALSLLLLFCGTAANASLQFNAKIVEPFADGENNVDIRSINDEGVAVGSTYGSGGPFGLFGRHGFLFDAKAGSMTRLGTRSDEATGFYINNKNHVVGRLGLTTSSQPKLFFHDGGDFEDMGYFKGQITHDIWHHGLNDNDVVIGHTYKTAWQWTPTGGYTQLAHLVGDDKPHLQYARPTDINNHNVIVGFANDEAGKRYAVKWTSPTSISVIETPETWLSSTAIAINNLGHVIGIGVTSTHTQRMFLHDGEAFYDIGGSPSDNSSVTAFNDLGYIVGVRNGVQTLWANGQSYSLRDYLPPGYVGFSPSPLGFNNLGQIVGYITEEASGLRRGIIISIPEPSSLFALIAGFALCRRSRRGPSAVV